MEKEIVEATEREWMRLLKEGNMEAFNRVFRRYYSNVFNYVYRLSNGDRNLSEDVVQQVFLNLWKYRENHDPERPIAPLLYTMARQTWIKTSSRESARRTATLDETRATATATMTPDRRLHQKELAVAIDRVLAQMDEPLREVFILSRNHGLKYREIAQVLGISIKTVEARMTQALDVFEEKLADFLED